jgi:hypothetical protein
MPLMSTVPRQSLPLGHSFCQRLHAAINMLSRYHKEACNLVCLYVMQVLCKYTAAQNAG